MDIIQLLPDSIANQIAAGEVVQRPASVVKELMENAVDAQASHIKLIIKDAGKVLIQVIDNGKGMSETDARMSLERHATSKIKNAEDLFTLHTMGFRGEALASIAAVSQMEIITKLATEELGTCVVVEGSDIKKQETVACEKGTNIKVKNLFYNIPARRNFLKSNAVETRHIIDEFIRLSVAHPSVSFTYIHGDEVEFDLSGGKLNHRIVSVFGKNYQQQLAACQEATEYVSVKGYVGKPEAAKKTRGEQFLYVNNRYIRNNYLHHAVMTAFEGLLSESSYPFYVLFIEINPKHIDVNIHPTKTEIKFDDERAVYGVVHAAVRQAIGSYSLRPSLDFQDDTNIIDKLNTQSVNKELYYKERFQTTAQQHNVQHWEKLMDSEWMGSSFNLKKETTQLNEPTHLQSFLIDKSSFVDEPILFQFNRKYIVRNVKPGLMFIDQQAAHERILFEKFLSQLSNKSGESQQCLFPKTVTLNNSDFSLLMDIQEEVSVLGFRFELFGKNSVLISGTPANLPSLDEKQLLEKFIEQYKINKATLSLSLPENMAYALAKRAAICSGQKLLPEEMRSLADGLMVCKTPNYSPDGSPTFFIFETSKIETYFKRP